MDLSLNAAILTWFHQFMAPAVETGLRTFVSFAFLTSIGFIWTFVLRGYISGHLNETFVNVAFTLYTAALTIVFCTGCVQIYKWIECFFNNQVSAASPSSEYIVNVAFTLYTAAGAALLIAFCYCCNGCSQVYKWIDRLFNSPGSVSSFSSESSLHLREERNQPSAARMVEPEFDNGNFCQRRVELLNYFENDLLQELLRECTRDQIHAKLNDCKTAEKMLQCEFYRKVDYDGLVEFIRCTDLNYPQFENDRNDIEYDHNSKSKHRKRIWELISKLIETHGSNLTPARLLNAAKKYDKQIYYDNFYEAFEKVLKLVACQSRSN